MDQVKFLILSNVEEDYDFLWELASALRQNIPDLNSEPALSNALLRALQELVEEGLIEFYQGYSFSGEEQVVSIKLSLDFIRQQLIAWETIRVNFNCNIIVPSIKVYALTITTMWMNILLDVETNTGCYSGLVVNNK